MAMDWIAALGAQDNSIEGLLAKRDLSKQMAQLQSVANSAEDRRQFDTNQDRQREALKEQIALRKAQQDETFQNRRDMKDRQAREDKQSRYNVVADNLHRQVSAGITPHVDPQTAAMMREFEGPASVEDLNTPAHPDVGPVNQEGIPDFVYAKHEAEAAQLKAKQAEERQRLQEQREAERLGLARNEDARQREALDLRKQHDAEMKKIALDKAAHATSIMDQMRKVPGAGQAVKARAEQLIQENSSFLTGLLPWEQEAHKSDYWAQAAREQLEQYQKQGLIPPSAPAPFVPGVPGVGGGRGAAPGAGANGAPRNETPEARKARLTAQYAGGGGA